MGVNLRKIYRKEGQIIQFNSQEVLKDAIKKAWNNFDFETLQNLVKSMPSRCLEVVKKRGSKIDY